MARRARIQRTGPEEAAARVLRAARAQVEAMGEAWQAWPIDVEFIAALLFDLGVRRTPGLAAGGRPYSGLLEATAGLIVVEASHHPHRQRFTIAHELGHYVLHYRQGGAGFYGDTADTLLDDHATLEAEANAFAAELLMPAEAVDALHTVVRGDPVRMARHFAVSVEAMERRLRRLGLPYRKRSPWG